MTAARHNHRQAELIAGGDGVSVTDAATGLDHRGDAVLRCQAHGVIEGEEAIAGQDRTAGLLPSGLQGNFCRCLLYTSDAADE